MPGTTWIGFLSNPAGASMRLFAQSVDTAARNRGVAIVSQEAATPGELAPAFDQFGNQGVQAVIVPVNGLFRVQRTQIAQLALAARLPTVCAERQYIEAGMLASYGSTSARAIAAAPPMSTDSEGRQSWRSANRVPDHDRNDGQPEDRKSAWPRSAGVARNPRRRGDRMMGWMAPLRHRRAKLVFSRIPGTGSHP